MQHSQNIQKEVLSIDIRKPVSVVLLVAVMSFFMHLVLHNYNDLKKKYIEEAFYTGQITENISSEKSMPDEDIFHKKSDNLQPKVETPAKIILSQPKQKGMNSKKIGNIVVISIARGDSLIRSLKEAKIDKANAIAEAVSKKYRLSNIKPGDVLQIENLSNSSSINLKLVLVNKVEIIVKETGKTYSIVINDLQKKNIFKAKTADIKRITLDLSQESIQKYPFTQDLKRDFANIVQLLKHEKIFSSKLEVVYERKSSKNEKLLYINSSGLKIYKYTDSRGSNYYVKQNGMLLLRETRKKPVKLPNFNISYPINNPVVGSGFGMRPHPIMKKLRMHKGVDFRACKGTPIHAPADGTIVDMNYGRGFGKYIRMRHNGVYTTLYAHLDNFAKDKRVGIKVRKGEVIGYVGKTGMASGEHLHFEIHENGRPVNPIRLITSNGTKEEISVRQLTQKQLLAFKNYQLEIDRKVHSL